MDGSGWNLLRMHVKVQQRKRGRRKAIPKR
jgi:hypothetical protein